MWTRWLLVRKKFSSPMTPPSPPELHEYPYTRCSQADLLEVLLKPNYLGELVCIPLSSHSWFTHWFLENYLIWDLDVEWSLKRRKPTCKLLRSLNVIPHRASKRSRSWEQNPLCNIDKYRRFCKSCRDVIDVRVLGSSKCQNSVKSLVKCV